MSGPIDDVKEPLPAHGGNNAPDWEIPEDIVKRGHRTRLGGTTTRWAIADRLDRILPPHKRYFGRSRRMLFVAIAIITLLLVALIVGLAVGLTKKSKHQALPLPNGAQTYSGDLTFYDPGLGSCGITSGENDPICAVSHYTFDAAQKGSDPNSNPLCGRMIRAQRLNNGKTVSVDLKVVDRCTGCQPTDIDVSRGIFKKFADPDLGRVNVTWAWL